MRVSVVSLTLLALVGYRPVEAQLKLMPFDIRVPALPTPVLSDDKYHWVYELRITNLGAETATVTGLDVLGDGGTTPLAHLSADDLKTAARFVGAPVSGGDSRTLPSGRQTLVYLWVSAPKANPLPERLRHRFTVEIPDSTKQIVSETVDSFFVPARSAEPIVISPPFAGGPWVAVNGPSNTSGHRRTAVPIQGEAQIGQRFATDWIKLGPDGLAFHGDSLVNANWYSYGTPVVAVADGIVAETKDSIIENVPFSPTMAVPITLVTVGGNHVVLDLGNGRYAFYAHLQPGSLKVKLGDRVRKGQVLGWLGNSGNSTAPHLHFHVGNRVSPLGSEGLPFVFERYQVLDWPTSGFGVILKGWKPTGAPAAKVRETPLENMIIQLP